MENLGKAIIGAPLANIFIIAGIIFLLIAVIGKISGKIEPGNTARVISGTAGVVFVAVGLAMHLFEPNDIGPADFVRLIGGGGKCLDASSSDFGSNGAKVQLWDCHRGLNQEWRFDEAGRVVNGGGKCLDANGPDFLLNAGKVQIWDCHDGLNQKWHFDKSGRIVNGGGKCLDANAPDIQSNGGRIQLWDCHSDLNQVWKTEKSRRDPE
jgi:hypothetical protein